MLVYDVETTGKLPRLHSIHELGALFLPDGQYDPNPELRFHRLCKPWVGAEVNLSARYMPPVPLDAAERIPLQQGLEELFAWAQTLPSRVPHGHNVGFDILFTEDAANRYELDFPFSHHSIDLHTIALQSYQRTHGNPYDEQGQSKLRSDAIMRYVGLPTEPVPHVAMNGVLWEAEAFSRLLYGKSTIPQFAKHPIPEYLRR